MHIQIHPSDRPAIQKAFQARMIEIEEEIAELRKIGEDGRAIAEYREALISDAQHLRA